MVNVKAAVWTTVVAVVSLLLSSPTPAQAGWVDDWIDQKTETQPGYFEGQKRGYYTGGGFSARWQESEDYPVTVEPPTVKAGCGGIDVMTGSLSLLKNTKYLQDKLSGIMANAGVFAFDIALKTLCPQCSETMSKLEAMADRLNQIQFSDCKAGKAVAMYINPATREAERRAISDASRSYTDNVKTGWQEVKDAWAGNGNEPTQGDANGSSFAGCPQELRSIFGQAGKSVLQAAGEIRHYKPEYMDLARGLIGDVVLRPIQTQAGITTYVSHKIPPCVQNKKMSMDSFVHGKLFERPVDGSACVESPNTHGDLETWSKGQIESIVTKIKDNSRLTPSDENYINVFPMPAYDMLKDALKTEGMATPTKTTLAFIGARAYAFGMMSDLYEMINNNIALIERVVAAQASRSFGPTCAIEGRISSVIGPLKEMKLDVAKQAMVMGADYQRATIELANGLRIAGLMSRNHGKGHQKLIKPGD